VDNILPKGKKTSLISNDEDVLLVRIAKNKEGIDMFPL